ncbi:MAG: hypothetical protein FJ405_06645 [Verrucomicrobia bacterium]|nr:hypothetical protein [Verrucomicrobiota bacterium]
MFDRLMSLLRLQIHGKPTHGWMRGFLVGWLVLSGAGCDFEKARKQQEEITRRLPAVPAHAPLSVPTNAVARVVESSLCPAILFQSSASHISLFTPGRSNAMASPAFVAYGAGGPKILTNGPAMTTNKLGERWILAWFNGAPGWGKEDAPVALFLEHPPTSLALDSQGLHITFPGSLGQIAVMSLYGDRSLPSSAEGLAGLTSEEAKRTPKTWEWARVVPREPLTRIRFWSSAFARIPLSAWTWEEASTKPPPSRLGHMRFGWMEHPSAWQAPRLYWAPVEVSMGRRWVDDPRSMYFEPRCFNMDWPAASGPLALISDAEGYSVEAPELPGDSKGASQQWTEWAGNLVNPIRFEPEHSELGWSTRSLGRIRWGGVDGPFRVVSTRLTASAQETLLTR